MSNPYETPASDLDAEKQPVSKTKWKVFFWGVLVLDVLSLITILNDPERTFLYILLEAVVYSSILIGLFGFSFNRKIINRKVWGYMIPIGIAFDIYSISYSLSNIELNFESPEEMYVVVAIAIALVVPLMFLQYLALFKYSLRSPEIWGSAT